MDFNQQSNLTNAVVQVVESAESVARQEFPNDDPVVMRNKMMVAFQLLYRSGQTVTETTLLNKYRAL